MEWMNIISNMDTIIEKITISELCLTVYIKLWNNKRRQINFYEYYAIKEKNSIGREIGDVLVQTKSILLDELECDIKNNDGVVEGVTDVKSIIFYDSWNEIILLEVLTKKVEFI